MKPRKICVSAVLLLAVSCGLKELGAGNSTVDEDIWVRPDAGSGSSERQVCMMTVFSYPESFDWTSGNTETVKCSVILMEETTPLLKVPVGSGYETSHDPDRYRIINGHLYTDFSDGTETIVKRDGKELFHYQGEERISAMAVENGNVHTLSTDSSGDGFSWRRNGAVQMTKHSGYVFERLEADGGQLCFAYCRIVETDGGATPRYCMVRDGTERIIDLPERIDKVWDIISRDGEDCIVCSSTMDRMNYIIRDGRMNALDVPMGAQMLYCRFLSGGPGLCCEGMYADVSGRKVSALWLDGNEYRTFDNGRTFVSVIASEGGICCIQNPVSESDPGIIFKEGKTYVMPSGYRCIGAGTMAELDGCLYVGLSSSSGGRPLIWKDGVTDTLDFNGFICSASVRKP